MNTRAVRPLPPMLRVAAVCFVLGLLFSAPFAFFPKSEVIGVLAFALASLGLALGGRLRRIRRSQVVMHGLALAAAAALFAVHGFDLLYVKFMLSLLLSFQLTLAERRLLDAVRDALLWAGARGAALAIVSFAVYFAFDMAPWWRTLLGDERSLPFFGLTNINFGFDNPELIIFARPAFLFDEPGQFAHFVLLSLALIGVSSAALRQRWRREVVLLVFAGLATFSLAFLIITLIYLATRITRWQTWLVVAGVAVAALALSDNPLVEALQWRLGAADTAQADDDRAVSGDNRTREVQLAYEAFIENPVWGAGWSAAERTLGHFAANPLGPLGYSGLMALVLYLPLLARLLRCARSARDAHQLLVVALVALFFSQRPYFYFPIFMALMEMLQRQMAAESAPGEARRGAHAARTARPRVRARPARRPGSPAP
ncbi:hypothetical protein ISF6_2857 [Piscinibacter sakaiensis]|uniref:Uncharacterized protein n=1 Tax=Piscinibacter sakaiensis TaxID=1547922 RepID=A0A0K8P2U7_PISS1|nr:hypothetical protein ISF6_2857 [Piscinibacter sakaiensis]